MIKLTTMADVAERVGCSVATVSAVIKGKGTVSPTTRERVLEVVHELNYKPVENPHRRSKSRSNKIIGFIVKEDDNPYYNEIISGVRQVAQNKDYLIVTASSGGSFDVERQIVELMVSKEISGLLITPALDGDADLAHVFELKRRNIPFVLLEQIRGIQTNLVDVDNVKASESAATYLIENGHSRIIHFAGPSYSIHSDERIEGVHHAFSRCSLAFTDEDVVYAGAGYRDGYTKGLEYFGARPRPDATAVTCYNDLVAIGLITALRELRIRVPEDISVIGFDDLELLNYSPWSLSSVRIPKQEMGIKAAEILIRNLESDKPLPLEKVSLPHRLIIRRSTAPLKPKKTRSVVFG